MESALVEKLELAKQNKRVLNALILEYTPFIKKSAAFVFFRAQQRQEALTEAMLAFVHAVQTYNEGDGVFINYAGTVIHNRLLDTARRETKIQKRFFSFPFDASNNDENAVELEHEVSRYVYDIAKEKENLRMEITEVNKDFSGWGFNWKLLLKKCPKQERSRRVCFAVVKSIFETPGLIELIIRKRQLPVTELAATMGFSKKILEKYRHYIVAVIVLLEGDYPYIRAFLPHIMDNDFIAGGN
jgi:RNA polymerase sigma factor